MSVQRPRFNLNDWSNEHGIIHHILPMKHRKYNPITLLEIINDGFDSLPETKSTWLYRDVDIPRQRMNGTHGGFSHLPHFTGAYRINKSTSHTRWTIPGKPNPVKVYTEKSRKAYAIDIAKLGLFSLSDVAERFNTVKQAVHGWFDDGEWSHYRKQGKDRIARTVLTIVEWTDHTIRHICELLPVSRSTFYNWLGYVEDFEPPERPDMR